MQAFRGKNVYFSISEPYIEYLSIVDRLDSVNFPVERNLTVHNRREIKYSRRDGTKPSFFLVDSVRKVFGAKMTKRQTSDAAQRFDAYYASIYADRWTALRAAMTEAHAQREIGEPLLHPYYLDEASFFAADILPAGQGDDVLDMCAAPGGKTLVLALKLQGTGSLICNDRSATRRARLRTVIDEHLPASYRANIMVTGHDASRWGLHEQQAYDHVLLDAPCSSERHVINDHQALSQWSESRPKRLAIQQFAMLAAALEAVRIGGTILYSTCSINPAENERVIEKLYDKRNGRFEELRTSVPYSEQRPCGAIVLPDTALGRGPLFFCLLRRLS